MNKTLVLLVLGMGIPHPPRPTNVAAGASAATIQNLVNQAGSAPGNTVAFAAGSYSLSDSVLLPCGNGTVYTGPNVGVVTSDQPAAGGADSAPYKLHQLCALDQQQRQLA